MKNYFLGAAILAVLLTGCGEDKASTVAVEGTSEVFSLPIKAKNATVEAMNFDQPLGISTTSDGSGAFRLAGIPKGTDATVSVLATDSYLGKPTYTFHAGGSPLQADLTGRTFYVVSEGLANSMLQLLGYSGVPTGVGVVAGSIVRVVDGEEKGIIGAKAASDPALTPIYFAAVAPDKTAKATDSGGRFIFFGLPAGKATITATGSDGSALGTSTVVVYDQAVSLVTIYAQ